LYHYLFLNFNFFEHKNLENTGVIRKLNDFEATIHFDTFKNKSYKNNVNN